ncbi:MAG: UDP-N-acetylmuramate dehydrogenase [bacterium]|nr:UDP-N-acetylmuramate dehydrogenase [bacterium]
MINKFITYVKDNNLGVVLENVNLKKYNTYRLEHQARVIVSPSSITNLKEIVKYLFNNELEYIILGNGSNVIFKGDYNKIILMLDKLTNISINNGIVTVGAGYKLMKLSHKLAKLGYTNLEFASAIPGSVGGAVYMNAGAYNKSISDVLVSALILTDDLQIKEFSNAELEFSYRSSLLKQKKKYICLEASFKIELSNSETILNSIKEKQEKRSKTQPLEFPSAGSVFRNPLEAYAGELIENLGLKNKNINGAEVSSKHANFIINKGNAKGEDIISLIELIKKEVKNTYNIELLLEQEIIQ